MSRKYLLYELPRLVLILLSTHKLCSNQKNLIIELNLVELSTE